MAEEEQTSGTVLMVRPASFGFHAEAARSNPFANASAADLGAAAGEFDALAQRLDAAGVEVLVLNDNADPAKPDAVFPNNWVSFHDDGTMVLYPMATAARRLERNPEAVKALLQRDGFEVRRTIDLSRHEEDGCFLEGTGSLILDRPGRRAFASVSARTHPEAVERFDQALGYSTFTFDARDPTGIPIYHTNVLMSLGRSFAILCTDAVAAEHRAELIGRIAGDGRELVQVDYDQLRQFACNLIELKGRNGPVIAMSSAARRSFQPAQLRSLERFGELVEASIPTIEAVGGGSVRCMIADVHLPRDGAERSFEGV